MPECSLFPEPQADVPEAVAEEGPAGTAGAGSGWGRLGGGTGSTGSRIGAADAVLPLSTSADPSPAVVNHAPVPATGPVAP
jgi:hypothetical protein